ncbi:MAG: acyl carrier protein [Streptosporangiaceae bacterium]|nr:acyl carrier protein [Streptosporangiaceae bacterium]
MDRIEAVELIGTVIAKVLGRTVPGDLSEDTRLLEGLGMDSTAVLEMLMELEDCGGFQVEVDELDPRVFQTMGTLADYVCEMTAAAGR